MFGENWPCLEVLEAPNQNYRNIRLSFNRDANELETCSTFIYNTATGQIRFDNTSLCWEIPDVNENNSLYENVVLRECDVNNEFQIFEVDPDYGRVRALRSEKIRQL